MHLIYPRDERLLHLLDEHLVLTTKQIDQALFGALRSCQRRLAHLKELELIDSFSPPRPVHGGSGQPQWVLGRLGLDLHAAERNERMSTPAKAKAYKNRLSQRPSLRHLLGVNGFFTALLGQAHHSSHVALAQWWSERTTADAFGIVYPDGLGLWLQDDAEVGFFLEYDTGTENLSRLVDKLRGYEHLAADHGPVYPVLFCLPSRKRELNLHTELAGHHGVTVATAVHPLPDPSGAVWAIVGHDTATRHRLAHLPSHHGPADPRNPVYRNEFIDPP